MNIDKKFSILKELPELKAYTKNGLVKRHQIRVYSYQGDGYIQVTWASGDGKEQTSVKKIKPKNEGKSNYRNSIDQALSEAEALFTRKKEREQYVESLDDIGLLLPLPMLLKDYCDYANRVTYPCLA